MDAALQSDVEFADIRVGTQRQYDISAAGMGGLSSAVGYSVRVRAQGTWSVKHGTALTTDAVTSTAREAAVTARNAAAVNATLRRTKLGGLDTLELAPAPVVTGEWHVPVEVDPFTVPFDDTVRLCESLAGLGPRFGHVGTLASVRWTTETIVFASTDGSLVTQTLPRAIPNFGAVAWLPSSTGDTVYVALAGAEPASRGYEIVLATDLPDRYRAAAEEAIRLRELPITTFDDVGRYPIVFGGSAFAALAATILSPALDGDRIFGFEADASGDSFLVPIDDALHAATPAFSPLLTMSAHRALPSPVAVGWDDDGVTPEPYTLIEHGRVVDVHTTRDTAPLMAEWYRQRNQPMRSHGCSVTASPTGAPVGGGSHVVVHPASTTISNESLWRDMTHGFFMRGLRVNPSPTLSSAAASSGYGLEIKHGKPIARLNPYEPLRISVAARSLFDKQMVALGGSNTVGTGFETLSKSMPWQRLWQPATAPAARCDNVDVIKWS